MICNDLKDLVRISKIIGSSVANVQGGGGNTSVKKNDREMIIKASGSLLKDMSSQSGYSVVDYPAINSYMQSPDKNETDFSSRIKSFVLGTESRPSIETGFHACLGRVVIHSHSVYTNILSCSVEGETLLSKIIPEACWVKYCSPGRELTLAVKDLANQKDKSKDLIIILQNHGLIISSESSERALELHAEVSAKIKSFLKIKDFSYSSYLESLDFSEPDQRILFPDQVVYTISDQKVLKTEAAKETLASFGFLLDSMRRTNLNPRFLEQSEIEFILSMESEKYRLKVIKNDSCTA